MYSQISLSLFLTTLINHSLQVSISIKKILFRKFTLTHSPIDSVINHSKCSIFVVYDCFGLFLPFSYSLCHPCRGKCFTTVIKMLYYHFYYFLYYFLCETFLFFFGGTEKNMCVNKREMENSPFFCWCPKSDLRGCF